MNNNQMNFDPMTGQPINQNASAPVDSNTTQSSETNIPVQPTDIQATETSIDAQPQTQNAEINPIDQNIDTAPTMQQQMNTIPTVDQNKETFINNTQANTNVKKEDKKDGPNWAFIIILFVIIFASIFFLFPYLLKVL